jgi:hypothetical protein
MMMMTMIDDGCLYEICTKCANDRKLQKRKSVRVDKLNIQTENNECDSAVYGFHIV